MLFDNVFFIKIKYTMIINIENIIVIFNFLFWAYLVIINSFVKLNRNPFMGYSLKIILLPFSY